MLGTTKARRSVDAHLDSLAIEKAKHSSLIFGWRSTQQTRVDKATGDVAGVVQSPYPRMTRPPPSEYPAMPIELVLIRR